MGSTTDKKIGYKIIAMKESTSILLHFLRALSAQMVVIGHGLSFMEIFPFLQPPNFAYIQNIGVVILFILSGITISFSLYRNIEKKYNYDFWDFFIDRFSRIYTGFIPALIFVTIIDLISININSINYTHYNAFNLKTFVGNLLMLQDYPIIQLLSKNDPSINITSYGSGRPFWALAVEWWIYLLFGWYVFRLKDRLQINKYYYYIISSLFLIVPLFNLVNGRGNRLTLVWLIGVGIYFYIYQNLKKCDSARSLMRILKNLKFAVKCKPITISSRFFAFEIEVDRNPLILSIIFLILSICYLFFRREAYDLIFEVLLSSSILFLVIYTNTIEVVKDSILKRIVIYFSGYSYTLFLIHYSIFELFVNYKDIYSPLMLFIVAFSISNLMASFMAIIFEKNYRRVSNFLRSELFLRI
jgi:hypothetical protein